MVRKDSCLLTCCSKAHKYASPSLTTCSSEEVVHHEGSSAAVCLMVSDTLLSHRRVHFIRCRATNWSKIQYVVTREGAILSRGTTIVDPPCNMLLFGIIHGILTVSLTLFRLRTIENAGWTLCTTVPPESELSCSMANSCSCRQYMLRRDFGCLPVDSDRTGASALLKSGRSASVRTTTKEFTS